MMSKQEEIDGEGEESGFGREGVDRKAAPPSSGTGDGWVREEVTSGSSGPEHSGRAAFCDAVRLRAV